MPKFKCDILGDFQTLCQGLQEYFTNETFWQRKVTGCGKNRGFQLVLDAQRIQSLLPKSHLTRGFKVFVTIPGVITSKVPFWADPTFRGEHNFYIHGIHVIKVHNLCVSEASFWVQFHCDKSLLFDIFEFLRQNWKILWTKVSNSN